MELSLFFKDVPCGQAGITIIDRLGLSKIRMKYMIDMLIDMVADRDEEVICPIHHHASIALCMEKIARKCDRLGEFGVAMMIFTEMMNTKGHMMESLESQGLRDIDPSQYN